MKNLIKPLIIVIIIGSVLISCLPNPHTEARYSGTWKLVHFYNGGMEQTNMYYTQHGNHVIYLQANNSFNEQFIENGVMVNITGIWGITDHMGDVILRDDTYGNRKFKLKYNTYLSFKKDGNEWVFGKL